MTDPYVIPERRIKRAGATRPYTIDFKAWLRSYWIPGRAYNNGEYVRSPTIPGLAYQAGNNGEAGAAEPAWPRSIGGTVVDGSITWTAVAPSTNALDALATVTWSQVNPPDGTLLISGVVNTNEEATATFAAGTQGMTYRIQCAASTASGKVYPVQFDLEVS